MKLTKPNIFKRIKTFFSTLRYIVSNYRKYQDNTAVMIKDMKEEIASLERDIKNLYDQVGHAVNLSTEAVEVIKERTQLSADISPSRRDLTYIFVSGRYRDRDYVKLFHIGGEDFKHVVDMLREMEKYAGLKYVDAPYMMEGVLKQEIERF